MNRLAVGLVVAALVLGGVLFYLFPRPERAPRPSIPMASGPVEEPAADDITDPDAHIPPQFQGAWAPDRLSCTRRGETARVDIAGDGMKFYESAGRLLQVTPLSSGREYTITLEMKGEGETWTRTIHLRRVGHELAFRDAEDEEEALYIRC